MPSRVRDRTPLAGTPYAAPLRASEILPRWVSPRTVALLWILLAALLALTGFSWSRSVPMYATGQAFLLAHRPRISPVSQLVCTPSIPTSATPVPATAPPARATVAPAAATPASPTPLRATATPGARLHEVARCIAGRAVAPAARQREVLVVVLLSPKQLSQLTVGSHFYIDTGTRRIRLQGKLIKVDPAVRSSAELKKIYGVAAAASAAAVGRLTLVQGKLPVALQAGRAYHLEVQVGTTNIFLLLARLGQRGGGA